MRFDRLLSCVFIALFCISVFPHFLLLLCHAACRREQGTN